jgi:hypothetical protein
MCFVAGIVRLSRRRVAVKYDDDDDEMYGRVLSDRSFLEAETPVVMVVCWICNKPTTLLRNLYCVTHVGWQVLEGDRYA